ncbi:MmyB family transcriptional regulator [Winogradskya humida]|uniref:MmyB family transcriptional regulator n=1 Tax=Winogradskya humida TaxID=113566 RepID=UPI0034DAD752
MYCRCPGSQECRPRQPVTTRACLRPPVQRILDSMTTTPAGVFSARLDALGTNTPGPRAVRVVNLARFTFTDPAARTARWGWTAARICSGGTGTGWATSVFPPPACAASAIRSSATSSCPRKHPADRPTPGRGCPCTRPSAAPGPPAPSPYRPAGRRPPTDGGWSGARGGVRRGGRTPRPGCRPGR